VQRTRYASRSRGWLCLLLLAVLSRTCLVQVSLPLPSFITCHPLALPTIHSVYDDSTCILITTPLCPATAHCYWILLLFYADTDNRRQVAPSIFILPRKAHSTTMRAVTAQALQLLLLSSAVSALPEITIAKHRHADFNPARLRRRQNGDSGGTVETNTYDVLTWSTGGAYYANGESCVR
jgi:hypothetical protein